MRIPWYYTVALCLVILFLGLYLGTKNRDFTDAPSDDAVSSEVEAWRATKPSLKNTKLPKQLQAEQQAKDLAAAKARAIAQAEAEAKRNAVPDFDPSTIQIETSLMLDHFKNLDLSATDRLAHAKFLISKRQYQAAHLELERIIDSVKNVVPEQIIAATKMIQSLPENQSLWSPDPSQRKPLTIEISLDPELIAKSTEISANIEESLLLASGGIVSPKVAITSAAVRPGFPILSSLKISGSSSSTPAIRFSTSTDAELLIYKAIYSSLRNAALADAEINTPMTLTETGLPAKQALPLFITRYTWLRLIETL